MAKKEVKRVDIVRPTKLEVAMEIATSVAKRSHDAETKVGAVLIAKETGAIKTTGCNGFVRDADDEILPNLRPWKYPVMVHAEENLIANCAKHGISTDDCMIVLTMSPCVRCMRLLYQAGIRQVVVREKYRDFEDIKQMEDLEIKETKTKEGFFQLEYVPRRVKS